MARPSKKESTENDVMEFNNESNDIVMGEYPEVVDNALKEHPELKKAWVNNKGFVFTESTPEHMTEGGTLYENKYFNN